MPSPAKDGTSAVPTLLPPSSLYPPPSSPSGPRTLRKLQSAHNLGAKANSNNLPSMISQQRLLQQQQLHNHHQQQAQQQLQSIQALQQRSASPVRRNISNISNTATLGTGSAGNGITTLSSNNNRSPQRGRANSDAANIQQVNAAAASANASRRPLLGRSPALDALSIDRLVRDGPPDGDVVGALNNLRWKILETGIKSDGDGMSSARIYVWLILLDCPVLETDAYLSLVHRGASPAYSKIRNDTFRTLTTDPLFRRRVSEASLIRLLNAIAWKLQDVREEKILKHPPMPPPPASRQSLPNLQQQQPAHESNLSGGKGVLSMLNNAAADSSPSANTSPAAKNRARALTLTTEGSETSVSADPGTYVQGMNVLAAPFLYAARSEAEAFVAFHHLLTKECPGYIRGAMDGVHKGLALVDKVLAIVDSKLSLYLLSKNLSAEIYAFPSVLTLCACTPPLPEVLRLWDFLFAYGPHLNIVCIVAQLMMIRNQILTSPSPNKLLRSFPALQADSIKRVTLTIIRKLPADVYAEIVNHAL
ncbi:cell cycle arrest protein BUB2 [Sporothrix brasiliensis 5110]|uniref:Cell cycle arrest protein BUB2 n=1 Tax=Sporothrix brasiliensis 5110 TaxID=1398154 RepID=A0A0C2IBN5_9PEZI|nr:cell cycle arrest protein BUB2 [Sporothrix brasiliensis 5110]KIH86676.1 cell cycle arrest protein BUB2 [Sporothrix brasiliensis 5110]